MTAKSLYSLSAGMAIIMACASEDTSPLPAPGSECIAPLEIIPGYGTDSVYIGLSKAELESYATLLTTDTLDGRYYHDYRLGCEEDNYTVVYSDSDDISSVTVDSKRLKCGAAIIRGSTQEQVYEVYGYKPRFDRTIFYIYEGLVFILDDEGLVHDVKVTVPRDLLPVTPGHGSGDIHLGMTRAEVFALNPDSYSCLNGRSGRCLLVYDDRPYHLRFSDAGEIDTIMFASSVICDSSISHESSILDIRARYGAPDTVVDYPRLGGNGHRYGYLGIDFTVDTLGRVIGVVVYHPTRISISPGYGTKNLHLGMTFQNLLDSGAVPSTCERYKDRHFCPITLRGTLCTITLSADSQVVAILWSGDGRLTCEETVMMGDSVEAVLRHYGTPDRRITLADGSGEALEYRRLGVRFVAGATGAVEAFEVYPPDTASVLVTPGYGCEGLHVGMTKREFEASPSDIVECTDLGTQVVCDAHFFRAPDDLQSKPVVLLLSEEDTIVAFNLYEVPFNCENKVGYKSRVRQVLESYGRPDTAFDLDSMLFGMDYNSLGVSFVAATDSLVVGCYIFKPALPSP